jgi:hypothetical protein
MSAFAQWDEQLKNSNFTRQGAWEVWLEEDNMACRSPFQGYRVSTV